MSERIDIEGGIKPWWPGDKRVEPFMLEVSAAVDKHLEGQDRTEVYNRCYEAVYAAIKKYDKNNIRNVLR